MRYYLAPHRNQTVFLRVTAKLVDDLAAGDTDPATMSAHYRDLYNRGVFGNKRLLARLRPIVTANPAGITLVEGRLADHVDADEVTLADGSKVMVISDENELCMAWHSPWPEVGEVGHLNPADFELTEVEITNPSAAVAADAA